MRAFVFVCLLMCIMALASARRHHARETEESDKLAVTLYYEALCPYCMTFVTTQLGPSMLLNDRLPFADLQLIPYGNAHLDDEGNVVCQHGVEECDLNAWHGCILQHHNITEAMTMIACMMRGKKNRLDKCAEHYSIDVSDVKECRKSRSVNDILNEYGRETAEVKHQGVPAVALDYVYNVEEQSSLLNHFDIVFCAQYELMYHLKLKNCV
ncbi:GILT-like protein 2 [Drosophila miranda]|uniref:GILT-like protein 2 n=1 Tax=Drosophila miranda TaxID=7229 RepID=UPI0007E73948|nr:GILT-like protein 2 [Drosophila miranda]